MIEAKPTSMVQVLEKALAHRDDLIRRYGARMDEYAEMCDRWKTKYDALEAELVAARA